MGFRNTHQPTAKAARDTFEGLGEDLMRVAERVRSAGCSLAFGLTAPQVRLPNGDIEGSKWAVCTVGDFMSLRGVTKQIEYDIEESLEESQHGGAGEEYEVIRGSDEEDESETI